MVAKGRRRRQPKSKRNIYFSNRKVARSKFCDRAIHHIGRQLTEVRDQRKLGSCAAHAVCAAVSWYLCKLYNIPAAVKLSTQYVVDWGVSRYNIEGLSFVEVFELFMSKGVPLDITYPYEARKRELHERWDPQGLRVKIGSFTKMKVINFEAVCEHIQREGPVVAYMNVSRNFLGFKGQGIFDHSVSEDFKKNDTFEMTRHAVLVVGYVEEEECYIIQNSWGRKNSGFHGYIKIPWTRLYNFYFPNVPRLERLFVGFMQAE